jgi:PD-(D/E)XK endonuclease
MNPLGDAPALSDHPVEVGQRTEAVILGELVRRGYRVLVPFGVNHRYDFVIDQGDRFIRAQCKTGRIENGAIRFLTKSVQANSQKWQTRGYLGDADIFLVHCPENRRTYAIPVEEATRTRLYLRVRPTRNNQARGIRWAKDYELPA